MRIIFSLMPEKTERLPQGTLVRWLLGFVVLHRQRQGRALCREALQGGDEKMARVGPERG